MLILIHDRDRLQAAELPLAGGALARLPGPALWVSRERRVVDANVAALDLLLDVGDAVAPLRDAIVATLADGAARQIRIEVKGRQFVFQVAISADPAGPGRDCAIAVGQAVAPT